MEQSEMLSTLRCYGVLFLAPVAVLLTADVATPGWELMWRLSIGIFFGFKWLTWCSSCVKGAPVWLQFSYLLAWPGMDADGFLDRSTFRPEQRPAAREWVQGVVNLLAGATLFWGLASWLGEGSPFVQAWVGMIGVVLMLHFGSFLLLSCFWRSKSINARPVMQRPYASVSVSEFWGRRWNTAFRDITHKLLVRPLLRLIPAWSVILVVFLVSGVVHDIVISTPVGRGFGGPTVYFIVQGVAMLVERTPQARSWGLGKGGVRGWVTTLLVVVLPAPMLFHSPFLNQVVIPFMHATNALRS